VETLKAKLMEKTKELEKAEKSLTLCRDALNRGEKASLPTKLKGYEDFLEGVLLMEISKFVNFQLQNPSKIQVYYASSLLTLFH
jgi:hypothetical protein